ncbi:MAG: glycoside hydrolase family 88 protein [candidate division KSB1 bacterium]|nr:glycoside hydrolase family 88 protein [candidate division KSB1 bacterium]
MRLNLIFYFIFLSSLAAGDIPEHSAPIDIAKGVADKIIDTATFEFKDITNGEKFENINGLPLSPDIRLVSKYNNWKYWNGVIHIAMLALEKSTGEKKYSGYVKNTYDFILNEKNLQYFQKQYYAALTGKVDGRPSEAFAALNGNTNGVAFQQFFRLDRLDDCGAMGAALIEMYRQNHDPHVHKTIHRFADYIKNEEFRLEDGTLARIWPRQYTIWADDLYMSVPFMVRYAISMNDTEMLEDAVQQALAYYEYLIRPDVNICYHCYYSDTDENGTASWGRANGWFLLAYIDLLSILPEDHPDRNQLIMNLQHFIKGITRCQSQTGAWHQLLDKSDSYLELSCTAMFTYGIAKAVNQGWVHKDYADVAEQGWKSILSNMTEEYDVNSICVGTGIRPSITYYYNRPAKMNEPHGLGAVILAGIEMTNMEKYKLYRPKIMKKN